MADEQNMLHTEEQKKKHRWINDDIELTGCMTTILRNTIQEAEEADEAGSYEYFAIAETLDVIGKGLYACGLWTERDWDILCAKYDVNAM